MLRLLSRNLFRFNFSIENLKLKIENEIFVRHFQFSILHVQLFRVICREAFQAFFQFRHSVESGLRNTSTKTLFLGTRVA